MVSYNYITKLNIFTTTLCIFSLAYVLSGVTESGFGFVAFLPCIFLILNILFFRVYRDMSSSVVFNLFLFQACIRYCALPVLIVANQSFKIDQNHPYLNVAVIVMVVELTACFLVFGLYSKKQINSYLNRKTTIVPLRDGFFVILILILMFLYMYVAGTFSRVNAVWNLGNYIEQFSAGGEGAQAVTGLGMVMFTPFKVLLALLAISLIYSSNTQPSRKKWFYLLVIVFSSAFIVGTGRFSVVLFALPLLVMISWFLNKNEYKLIMVVSLAVLGIVILMATLLKFGGEDRGGQVGAVLSASSVDAYFSGPGNIAIGFNAADKIFHHESILYLANDVIQNVPFLSKAAVDDYRLTSAFNEEFYGHRYYADQIVPLSISGLFHFGSIGVYVYAALFVALALYMERLSHRSDKIVYRYVFVSLSITLSLVFMLNLGSFFGSIARAFLFLFLPFLAIDSVSRLKLGLR